MRTSNMSRVMAALLTKMVGSPSPASRSATSASMEARSPASSTAPRPLNPSAANSALMAAAPAALVAVPTTRAPARASARAMARPMPRDAPVTSARSFSSMQSSGAPRKRALNGGGVLERQTGEVGAPFDAPVETGQYLTRSAFDERLHTRCHDRSHGLGPMHRTCELTPEERTNVVRLRMRGGIHGAHEGDARRSDFDPGKALAQAPCGGLHQAAVRRDADGKGHGTLGAARHRRLDGSLHRIAVARDNHLSRTIEVDRFDDRALRRLQARGLHLRFIEPEDRHDRTAALGHRFLHGLRSKRDQLDRRFEVKRLGAYERRELAQAVAADDGRCRPTGFAPVPPGRNARGKHGGLRVFGAIQFLGRPLLDDFPKIVAECRGSLGEGPGNDSGGRRETGEHAVRLRTLPGE